MQGDPKVDELMRPVMAAIERHVKDRDAVTEIYNRAYEAVMNGMDAKQEESDAWHKMADELAKDSFYDDRTFKTCCFCGEYEIREGIHYHSDSCPVTAYLALTARYSHEKEGEG